MKNMYKKHCDLFIKSAKTTRVCLQRVENEYYITDGITALTVPAALYDNYIRPLNAIFIPLHDGETAAKHPDATFTEIVENGFNIKKTFEMYKDTNEQVDVTPLLYTAEKNKILRVVQIGEHVHTYDNKFIEAAAEYLCDENFKACGGVHPILKAQSAYGGCLILPIANTKIAETLGKLKL